MLITCVMARAASHCVPCRSFAVRRIKDGFKANKSLVAPEEIKAAYDKAVNSYELLQRQVRSPHAFLCILWNVIKNTVLMLVTLLSVVIILQ